MSRESSSRVFTRGGGGRGGAGGGGPPSSTGGNNPVQGGGRSGSRGTGSGKKFFDQGVFIVYFLDHSYLLF